MRTNSFNVMWPGPRFKPDGPGGEGGWKPGVTCFPRRGVRDGERHPVLVSDGAEGDLAGGEDAPEAGDA
jgi:hypothetical protein